MKPFLHFTWVLFLVMSLSISLGHEAQAATLFVNDATGADSGSCGPVPNSPCLTINQAITNSAPDDVINVSAGTFTETNLTIVHNLTVQGAGKGLDPILSTIVDGNDVASSVFVITAGDVTFSGLTITNGNSASVGGGIYASGTGDLTLNNCSVVGNKAASGGGGIEHYGTSFLTLIDSNVDNNQALTFDAAGIFTSADMVEISGSTISGNRAGRDGGGLLQGGIISLIIANSFIDNNQALGASGGGIFTSADALDFSGCSISGNGSADDGGGLLHLGVGEVSILNCTLSNNMAAGDGGGIMTFTAVDSPLINVTLSGNSALTGGGISHAGTGTIQIKNSILANGSSGGNCDTGTGVFASLGHNVSDDSTCPLGGTGDLPAGTDPLLGLLQDNGGNTLTQVLLAGSPARDLVPPDFCTDANGDPNTVDQRNFSRPAGGNCDAGALEFNTGAFQFITDLYAVQVQAGTATIQVVRYGGQDGEVTVDFTTMDDTAIAGKDYLANSGTLTFPQNVTSMNFEVEVIQNPGSGNDPFLDLLLSNPGGGAVIGHPSLATLLIFNNAVAGGCSLDGAQRPFSSKPLGWVILLGGIVGLAIARKKTAA